MVTLKYTGSLWCWRDMKQDYIYSLQYLNCIFCLYHHGLNSVFKLVMHALSQSLWHNTKWTQKMVWTTHNEVLQPRSTRGVSEMSLTARVFQLLYSYSNYEPAVPSHITSHMDVTRLLNIYARTCKLTHLRRPQSVKKDQPLYLVSKHCSCQLFFILESNINQLQKRS